MAATLPKWVIEGIITSIEAKKTKAGEVFAHGAKLMALGGTFSIQHKKPDVFAGRGEGENVRATGHFEQSGGYMNFVVDHIDLIK